MTDHELQLKAFALRRAGILHREIHEIRERGKGFGFALFAYFAWFAVYFILFPSRAWFAVQRLC